MPSQPANSSFEKQYQGFIHSIPHGSVTEKISKPTPTLGKNIHLPEADKTSMDVSGLIKSTVLAALTIVSIAGSILTTNHLANDKKGHLAMASKPVSTQGQVLAAVSNKPGTLTINSNTAISGALNIKGDLILSSGKINGKELISSLISGDNIRIVDSKNRDGTISPTVSVTLPNNLVNTFQGKSGEVKLEAGTDISISGLKLSDASTLSSVRGRGGCSACITKDDIAQDLTISSSGTISPSALSGSVTVAKGGTGLTTASQGDVLYASASDTFARLTIGTAGQSLVVGSSGLPSWSSSSSTQGIFIVQTSDTTLSSSVSTLDFSSNFSLTQSPSGEANVALATVGPTLGGTGLTSYTTGDMLYASDTNTLSKLGIGSSNQVLAISSGIPIWINQSALTGSTTAAGWTDGGASVYLTTSSDSVGIGTALPSAKLDIAGDVVINPSADNTTSLTVKATSGSSSSDIFKVTNAAGTSTYFNIDSTGSLSGSAFKLTDASNAIVGTAIEGGWTLDGVTYTYRRVITVSNTSASTLPTNYQVSVALSATDANQVYSKSQTSSPYRDFRVAYGSGTPTEIARNVSSFTSSDITFTLQLQAAISASGSDANYYIYYRNTTLATTPSTYTGNVQADSGDSVASWSSADTGYALSVEATSPAPQEGTGSIEAAAANGNITGYSTTNQNALPQGLKDLYLLKTTISGTDYLYALGGNNGTSDQTTVYKSTFSSGNVGSFSTTSQGQLPQALSGTVGVAVTPNIDGGTGADGAIDLANGGGAGGCTGTGLSWSGTTCTIATATKSTFNFTTVDIPSGTTLTTDGPKTTSNFVTLKATGNVTIAGTINLAGKGYDDDASSGSGRGPGAGSFGTSGSGPGGGGGGYGGAGGAGGVDGGTGGTGGATYTTEDSGSSGAMGKYWASTNLGGEGGGGIKIISSGTITTSGTVNANGNNGGSTDTSHGGAGGGSGGGISLTGDTLTISGTLSTNGGNGGNSGTNGGGGGGGGGRITLTYSSSITTTGSTITVAAGARGTCCVLGSNGSAGSSTQTASPPNLYVLGGINGSTAQSTVYKASLTSANVGTLATTSQNQLPQALYDHQAFTTSISNTNYIYVLGGNNGSADQTTVYRSTVDSSGNVGSFSTSGQSQLPQALSGHAAVYGTISSTNYVWVLGGRNSGTAQTTVYKATMDGSGNIGTFSATGQGTLPAALYGHTAFLATTGSDNYMYVLGGNNGSADATTVYKALIDGSGNIGSFSSTGNSVLSSALSGHQSFAATSGGTQYAYVFGGGTSGTAQTTVYRGTFNDMSNYSASRTITSSNWTNKNDLQFKYYSSRTGNFSSLDFSEDGTTWQSCAITVSSANTWETQTCDISGIAAASRNAVTQLRLRVTSSSTSSFTTYLDDINALMNASAVTNTTAYGRSILGASNLAINAQGTGLVQINYSESPNPTAGSGGFTVYNGTTTTFLNVDSNGNLVIGNAALATNASNGFLYLPSSAGAPTGTPTAYTGRIAAEYDSTNNKFCAYNGAWKCTGALTDYAEWAPAKGAEIGDVVSITSESNTGSSGEDNFMLGKSTIPYDKKLVGIVSKYAEEANMASGYKKSADYHAIALSGRVPVKVSLENGKIEPGDYLTSSSIPGVAMKASRPGQMIGRALESFSEGLGKTQTASGSENQSSGISDLSDPSGSSGSRSSSESFRTDKILVFVNPTFADPSDVLANLRLDHNGNLIPNYSISSKKTGGSAFLDPSLESSLEAKLLSLDSSLKMLETKVLGLEASGSANIASSSAMALTTPLVLTVASEASLSAKLAIYELTISDMFKSLGETLLGNTTIAGSLSVDGTLAVSKNSINVIGTDCSSLRRLTDRTTNSEDSSSSECNESGNISGILYLQSSSLAQGLDIFNGAVTIDKTGTLTATTLVTDQIKVSANKSAGTATIVKNNTKTVVTNPLAKPNSVILITPQTPLNQTLAVTNKTDGSFTVELFSNITKDINFNYLIVGVD